MLYDYLNYRYNKELAICCNFSYHQSKNMRAILNQ